MSSKKEKSELIVWKDGDEFYDDGYEDDERTLNNRIEFPADELYGRNNELETLRGHFQTCLSGADSPVCVVSGYSGCGKSSLVDHFVNQLDSNEGEPVNYLYLKGKYEDFQSGDPFSAIIQAFTGLCNFLLLPDQAATLQRIRQAIDDSLGNQARVLVPVIPALESILMTASDPKEPGTDGKQGEAPTVEESSHSIAKSDGAWNQMRFLFQTLLRAIVNEKCPVIMFTDDLQWCDAASLGLLRALLNDKSLKYFMFIGALRENEVDRDHPTSQLLDSIQDHGKNVHRISLRSLTLDEVGEFISDTLSLEVQDCQPLTEAVYSKTKGNIFHTRQAIEELYRSNALFYSVIAFRWEWNLTDVATGFSDTLEESVLSKIRSAPELLQETLLLAAYTRSTIDISMLHTLLLAYTEKPMDLNELEKLLETAVIEGLLLNGVGSTEYRFAHDRIQEAAYKLLPAGPKQNKLRLLIGEKLFESAKSSDNRASDDWKFFIAADHLNSLTNTDDEMDVMTLIQLNLTCGEKAVSVAAYAPACVYLRLALKALRRYHSKDMWTKHYDITLRVFQATSDVELCLGHFEDGNELGKEVLANARHSEDKVPTWMSLSGTLGRLRRHAEAKELCKKALAEISVTPKRFHLMHFMLYDARVKFYLKRHSDDDILCLPKLEDEKKIAELVMLNECGLRGIAGGDMAEWLFCTSRQLILTIQHGLCYLAAQPIATYGMIFSMSGDYKSATRMARLARSILKETTHTKEVVPYTLLIATLYVEAWTDPREKILDSLNEAQRIGMQSGNFEYGFLLWNNTITFLMATGYQLDVIAASATELLEQSRVYSVDAIYSMAEQQNILIQCLCDSKSGPDWKELESFRSEINPADGDQTYRFIFGIGCRLEIGVIFGNLEFAADMIHELEPFLPFCGMYIIKPMQLFLSCLTFAGLARKRNLRQNLSQARKYSKEMKKLVKTQGTNILHKHMLMDAAMMAARASKKDITKVATAFENGIAQAEDICYIQDAAIASEFAGEFFLSVGEEELARVYFQMAVEFYDEWGAVGKVRLLVQERNEYITGGGSNGSFMSTSARSETSVSRRSFVEPVNSCPVLSVPLVSASVSEEAPSQLDKRSRGPKKRSHSPESLQSELTWDQTMSSTSLGIKQ